MADLGWLRDHFRQYAPDGVIGDHEKRREFARKADRPLNWMFGWPRDRPELAICSRDQRTDIAAITPYGRARLGL